MDERVSIQISVEGSVPVDEDRLRAAVGWVLSAHEVSPDANVTIVIADDDEVHRLNRQFRRVDAPTDVLSFPAEPDPAVGEDADYLGDLVLALPYIERQAASEQHTVGDEVVLAVVHGTLHLLGYDHDSAAHQAEMWAVQAEALHELGVNIVVPQFEFPDEEAAQADTPEQPASVEGT